MHLLEIRLEFYYEATTKVETLQIKTHLISILLHANMLPHFTLKLFRVLDLARAIGSQDCLQSYLVRQLPVNLQNIPLLKHLNAS